MKESKLHVRDLCLMALMVAVIEVCKVAFAGLPNIELTTFWVLIFSICFGRKIFFVIPVFIAIEGAIYGFGLWWIMYLYAWPLLALFAMSFRKSDSVIFWSMVSAVFGLLFGFLCAIPYIFIGTMDGGLMEGFRLAFAWWVAGIPFDLIHGAGNFVIMLVLYHPITKVMKLAKRKFFPEQGNRMP